MLEDIEAIKRVQGQHLRAADTKDLDLLRPTVTEDFFVDTGPSGRGATQGVENFLKRVSTTPAIAVHHAFLPEIELTSPTTATGIWAVHVFAKTPDGSEVNGYGHYHNAYQKVDGSWRVRILKLIWFHREVRPKQP
jgi:ketosteroid isomerase-like protein